MSTSNDLTLVVKNGAARYSVPVKWAWIHRWQFLDDIVKDLGVSQIDWTPTDMRSVTLWVELNKRMDERLTSKAEMLHMTELSRVLSYMNPYTDEYLRYVYIDDTLAPEVRKDLYHRLGRYIRSQGEKPIYLSYSNYREGGYRWDVGDVVTDLILGIHYNLNLTDDILYRAPHTVYPPQILELLLQSQLSTATGILHTAWLLSRSYPHNHNKNPLLEVPWHLIRWDDLIDMAPNGYIYSWDVRNYLGEAVKILQGRGDVTQLILAARELKLYTSGKSLEENMQVVILQAESEVNTKELALRLLLSGRVSEDDELPQSVIPMKEVEGVLSIATPEPDLLLQRLLGWGYRGSSSPAYHILRNYKREWQDNKDRVMLSDVITRLIMGIAWVKIYARLTVRNILISVCAYITHSEVNTSRVLLRAR